MRPIKGKLYKTLKDCLLWEDDYNMTNFANVKEGSIVLMIVPSDTIRRHTTHKVVFEDVIGWIDLESEELMILKEPES